MALVPFTTSLKIVVSLFLLSVARNYEEPLPVEMPVSPSVPIQRGTGRVPTRTPSNLSTPSGPPPEIPVETMATRGRARPTCSHFNPQNRPGLMPRELFPPRGGSPPRANDLGVQPLRVGGDESPPIPGELR